MSCTRRFLNFQWEHHAWQTRVTNFETLVRPATNMWARVVDEEYMRCDKEDVCTVCGKTRKHVSCVCDQTRGETCKVRCESMAAAAR